MKLFIDIVTKRIYLFNIVAWNYRRKIGFPVCKEENFAGLEAHRKRGKSARASPTPHHTLNEEGSARFTAQPLSALVVTVHFSAALKALVLGNLFKVFRLDITFAREVCHLGIKMKKIWQSSHSFHYPQWQKARANVMANLSNVNE